MNHTDMLNLAFTLARQAGAAILEVRARGFETLTKADRSPVTEADHAAEAIITAGLRAATPAIPVVAEEEMAAGRVPGRSDAYWVVDPLDGTREFTSGRDEFAVCIGLVRAGKPTLGVVGAPAAGVLWGGIVGTGAWRHDAQGERVIAARLPPAEGLVVVASRSHGDPTRLDAFLKGRKVAKLINAGSALKFCRVAEGEADLYPRFGPTMEWDTAAAQAVLEAAGGQVLVLETMQPLTYGKPDWRNPHFLATGRV
jgi:3'(2'), 5'-bisphosphate nucleotidase